MARTTDPPPDGDGWHFSGFVLPTTTPVPDQLFDELLYRLSPAEMMVLLYIIRRTYGFKKQSDNISLKQMVEGIQTRDGRVLDRGTGLSKATVARALTALEEKNVILRTRRRSSHKGDEPTTYHLHIPAITDRIDQPEDAESDIRPVSQNETPRVSPTRHPRVSQRDTQQTVIQETDHVGVVARDALEQFGITKAVAERLATSYPEGYVLGKLDLVQWLVETGSPLVGKNPAGYLRRAIEEDYTAPPRYKSPAQRQAENAAQEQIDAVAQERRREAEAEYALARADTQQQLTQQYPPQPIPGTTLTTATIWEQVLERLQSQVTHLNFELWLKPTTLITCNGKQATIVAQSRFQAEHLAIKLDSLVTHTISTLLEQPVQCQYVSVAEVLQNGEIPSTTSQPSHTRTALHHSQSASP